MPEENKSPEYSARASIEGHRYHWTWTARRALSLVAFNTDLKGIAVEDLPEGYIDGAEVADTVEYYGGVGFEDCECLIVQQFKYSIKNPDEEFTWSFLTKTLNKFGKIYNQWLTEYGPEFVHKKARFALITNRPPKDYISKIFALLANGTFDLQSILKRDRDALTKIGLKATDLLPFLSLVTIQSSESKLFTQEASAKRVIADWSPGADSTSLFSSLRDRVLALAGAEGEQNNILYEADVWAILGVAGQDDLFPVPNHFPELDHVIERDEIGAVEAHFAASKLPLLVTADGGEGKTVFLQSIAKSFQASHHTIIFDCFAEGRYRIEGEERHLSKHAFTQLINSLATEGLCDLIVPSRSGLQQPEKIFRKRMQQAISTLKAQSSRKKVLLIIDAADNAAELAKDRNQHCFVHTILNSIKHQPIDGLDVVLSCRPYRKNVTVGNFTHTLLELDGLPKDDCLKWIKKIHPNLTSSRAEKIYAQARGNPRKIEYLLKLSSEERPDGKEISLDQIFDKEWTRISSRLIDQGLKQNQIDQVMAAIARLPPPIPLSELAKALAVSDSFLKSLTSDLFPLLEEAHDGLIFRDEPIETWFRCKFTANSQPVMELIKTFTLAQSKSMFAASALPQLLAEAKDLDGLLSLAQSENFPSEMVTQSAKHRLAGNRILAALRLAVEAQNTSTCMSLLYRYGRLATVDERADTYVVENTALAAFSNDQDASIRCWNNRSGWEGSWSARMATYAAIRGDNIGALNASYTFDSWLDWWFRTGREEYDGTHKSPRLSVDECVAKALSLTSNGKLSEAIDYILSWYPPTHQKKMGRRYFHLLRYLRDQRVTSVIDTSLDRIKLQRKHRPSDQPNSDEKVSETLGFVIAVYEVIDPSHKGFISLSRILNQELRGFNFEFRDDHPVRPSKSILSHQLLAVKAMRNEQKSLCKSLMKAGYNAEPSLYKFHDEHERGKLGFFMIQRVISAWLTGRELSRWDLLPALFRKRIRQQDCINKNGTNTAVKAIIDRANSQKSEKKPRNALAFSNREAEHFQWVISELYEFATLLSAALGNGIDHTSISELLNLVERDSSGAPYFLSHSAYNLRRHLFVSTLRAILFRSSPLDDVSLAELKSRLTPDKLLFDHNYSILEFLNTADPNAKVKSALSVALADKVATYETVDDRAKAYALLADKVMNFDGDSAKHLFLRGLNCMDGVGSDDDDLVRALLGLASSQRGGLLSLKASNRFLRLCEITFEHREDKFPFDELARACAKSVGLEYFRYLFGWHSTTSVPLYYGLLSALSRFAENSVIAPKQAALASLLSEGTGCWSLRADDLRLKIWQKADDTDKPVIESLFDWQRKFESGSAYSWNAEDVSKSERDEYPPPITMDKYDLLDERIKTKSWQTVHLVASKLDPLKDGFVETVVSKAKDEDFHVDIGPILYQVATTRLGHLDVLSFLDQIIQATELHAGSKISLVHAILNNWQDSSVTLRECRSDLYKEFLQVAAPEYLNNQFGASTLLNKLAIFSGKDKADVTMDFCDWVGKNREEVGSVTAFTLAQALIPKSSSNDARMVLEEFLQTKMFDDMDAGGEVPIDTSKSLEIENQEVLPQMIWHQLGDPDATLRWRAVHTFVKTAHVGDNAAVSAVLGLFDNPENCVLVHPEHKQHIWNAREYCLIAAINIALKHPNILATRLDWFIALANGRFENIILERYAGNIVHLLETHLGKANTHRLNHFPVLGQPLTSRDGYYGGDSWAFTKLEESHGFSLEYEFRKSYPIGFPRSFDISGDDAAITFMQNIKSLDKDCEGMRDAAGRPMPRQDHRDFRSERKVSYGQHIARHAVFKTFSSLLKSHSLVQDHWGNGNELDSLFSYETTTFQDGKLLHDETSPSPGFANFSMLTESGNEKTIKDATDIASALGFSGSNITESAWLPVQGVWGSPCGASVTVYSAFVENRGSVRKAKGLSALPWMDLWLPASNDDLSHMREDFQQRAEEFISWIDRFNGDAGEDSWDSFASTYAANKSMLSDRFVNDFGLSQEKSHWIDADQNCVAKSIAWGTKVTKYRDDPEGLGKAVMVSRSFLENVMQLSKLDLIIAVGVTYYPSSRYSSTKRKNLDGGVIIRLTPDGEVRTWKRRVKENPSSFY